MKITFKVLLISIAFFLTTHSYAQRGGSSTHYISVNNTGDVSSTSGPFSQYLCTEVSFIVNYTLNGLGYSQISNTESPFMGTSANLSVTIPSGAIVVDKRVKFDWVNEQYIYTVGSPLDVESGNFCPAGGNTFSVQPAAISPNVDFKVYCLGGCPL